MKKILIFEDGHYIRSMYATKYKAEGFAVAEYENPSVDPVSIVLKEKPDVISMNVIMPVMNGFDATKLIKADPRTQNTPIVFLTNLCAQEDIDKGKSLGAADYIIMADNTPNNVVKRFQRVLE